MFAIGKFAAAGLVLGAAAVPCSAWDYFWPDECVYRDCRRGAAPPPCGETRFAYSEEAVLENKEGFVIRLVTPGVPKQAYAVSVKNNILRIAICKKNRTEKKDGKKAAPGAPDFVRGYKLPPTVDQSKIRAVYKDGVMTISLPRTKVPEKPEVSIPVE